MLLNYGHTIGHAIEAVTGYDSYLHGEAVSVGMMGAANIGRIMGMTSESEVERQRAALSAYGLPLDARGVDPRSRLGGDAIRQEGLRRSDTLGAARRHRQRQDPK